MERRLSEEKKNEAITKMGGSLVVLRTMLHLTQAELAEIMGVTRQTLVSYETGKRLMPWSSYLALLFIFDNNRTTKPLLELMNIYPQEIRSYFELLDR